MNKSEWGLLLGMMEMGALLERWRMDEAEVRRRMYRAPTPRERERWHALWLLAQGGPVSRAAAKRTTEVLPEGHGLAGWAPLGAPPAAFQD